jgi:hypothetical protein
MMTRRVFTIFALATALAFPSSLVQLPMAWATASSSQNVDVEILVRVNQKGFLDQNGKVFNKRNILQLPEGKVVRINFVFDEAMSSLAYGDTHQVAITGDDWTKESDKIWMFSQKTSMTFQTGEEGARYRAYCILDCIGMEHLNNLVIQVV